MDEIHVTLIKYADSISGMEGLMLKLVKPIQISTSKKECVNKSVRNFITSTPFHGDHVLGPCQSCPQPIKDNVLEKSC